MDNYLIFMDVSGDVDKQFAADNGVCFIPMEYSLGDTMRVCEGMEPDDVLKQFYDGQRHGDFTKTTQITPFAYEEVFRPHMKDGISILYLCLSSGLSSTYESVCLAKANLEEEFPGVHLYAVDSLLATGATGVLCERAIRNQKAGMSGEDNMNDLLALRGKIHTQFLVQDLMYLKRGGRLSAATAVIGTALNIRPILMIDPEGKLVVTAKKRGTKMAMNELINTAKTVQDPDSLDSIYVIHADAPEIAAVFEKEMKEAFPNITVRTVGLSPIIGAHTGPDMAAIVTITK